MSNTRPNIETKIISLIQTKLPHQCTQIAKAYQLAVDSSLAKGVIDTLALQEAGNLLTTALDQSLRNQAIIWLEDANSDNLRLFKLAFSSVIEEYTGAETLEKKHKISEAIDACIPNLCAKLKAESLHYEMVPLMAKAMMTCNPLGYRLADPDKATDALCNVYNQHILGSVSSLGISEQILKYFDEATPALQAIAAEQAEGLAMVLTPFLESIQTKMTPFCENYVAEQVPEFMKTMRELLTPTITEEQANEIVLNQLTAYGIKAQKDFEIQLDEIFNTWKKDKNADVVKIVETDLPNVKLILGDQYLRQMSSHISQLINSSPSPTEQKTEAHGKDEANPDEHSPSRSFRR
jgi:hypothetical protein